MACLVLCLGDVMAAKSPPSPAAKNKTKAGQPKKFLAPPSPSSGLFPIAESGSDGLQWTISGPSPYFAFPAGSYAQVPPRNWVDSPYQFAWDPETPVDTIPGAQTGTRMCLIVAAKADYWPPTKCASWLLSNFYKVGITAGSALEVGSYRRCVKGTTVIRGDTGAVEVGVMTWVSRQRSGRNYSELHVHSFGASDAIYPGDKVCFYVDVSVCPTIRDLCGSAGSCAVSVWSGPSGKMIHQCSPSTSIPYPNYIT